MAVLEQMSDAFGENVTASLAVVGIVAILLTYARAAVNMLLSLYNAYIRPARNIKSYGEWAVVTGATDGIGKAYAEGLASKGYKIFLISRSPEKLGATAAAIEQEYSVETQTLAIDFSKDASIYDVIEKELSNLDIGILVNNVGIGYDFPDFFLDIDQDRMDKLIALNIVSVNQMTRIVLPGMVERSRGAIVNVSSGSGAMPVPLLTVYSATKAYVDFFSRGLRVEYASKGIVVQSLIPLFVTSKLSKIRKPSLTTPNPKTFVRSALRTLGHDDRTTGYIWHTLQLFVGSIMPTTMYENYLFKMHLGLRKRALRRKAEKAK